MRCLVVGGTGFLGGVITDELLAAGHDVAVLSRGRTRRASAAEVVVADRHGDLDALRGRRFDWVLDTCAYAPGAVTRLLDAVGEVDRYVLISSISAYGTFATPGLDETAPVPDATEEDLAVAAALPKDQRSSAEAYGAAYGRLKRACERAAETLLGDRVTSLRVGLLIGAGDYTDRLTWWVRRLDEARGSRARVPVPGPAERPVQLIDVRDLAAFARRCCEADLCGIWNVTGMPVPLRDLLARIRRLAGSEAAFVSVDPQAVIDAGIAPWTDLPLVTPPGPEAAHIMDVSTAKARAAGLRCRPAEESLEQVLTWDRTRRDVALRAGLSAAQERRLLAVAGSTS